jgi:hypothetical protein
VKKLSVLMFVVVAVLGIFTAPSSKRAEAGICPPEYISTSRSQSFDLMGDTTVAARVTLQAHGCYDNETVIDTSVSASSYSIHPRWSDGTITILELVDLPEYERYMVRARFTRWTVSGGYRPAVCVEYEVKIDAQGTIGMWESWGKHEC